MVGNHTGYHAAGYRAYPHKVVKNDCFIDGVLDGIEETGIDGTRKGTECDSKYLGSKTLGAGAEKTHRFRPFLIDKAHIEWYTKMKRMVSIMFDRETHLIEP